MKTPLLIEVGDANRMMFRHQGGELCNIARRARKDVVLLNYTGNHWLGKKAERAAAWIGRGTSVIERDALKRTAKGRSG